MVIRPAVVNDGQNEAVDRFVVRNAVKLRRSILLHSVFVRAGLFEFDGTPTYEVAGAEHGKIYRGEYGILVNCGVAFGEPLGCLRLEDGKEFYVR